MSKFEENLFGRIAVLNNYVTPDELRECLRAQKDGSGDRHIGEVLRERGHITEEQLERIVEIRNQKVRKLRRSQESATESDRELARVAIRNGSLDLGALESAVLEQQRLRKLNLHFSLVEVLVSRSTLSPVEAKRLLTEVDCGMLRCPVCDVQFRIVDQQSDEEYHCIKCDAVLDPPAYLDTGIVEGVVSAAGVELEAG